MARYDIYNETTKLTTSTTENCTLTGLIPRTKYTLIVKAVDTYENISTTGAAITITTLDDDYGDDISAASTIELGADVSAVINFIGDIDFFKFTPAVSGSYRIKSTGSTDTYGSFYVSDGALISSNDDGSDRNFLINANLDAGKTYYIAVQYFKNIDTGAYIVKIIGNKPDLVVTAISPLNAYPGTPVLRDTTLLYRRDALISTFVPSSCVYLLLYEELLFY